MVLLLQEFGVNQAVPASGIYVSLLFTQRDLFSMRKQDCKTSGMLSSSVERMVKGEHRY